MARRNSVKFSFPKEDIAYRRDTLSHDALQGAIEDIFAEESDTEHASQYDAFRERYKDDREAFVRECFRWPRRKDGSIREPAPYQVNILKAFDGKPQVAVRGPRGLGKTAVMSWLILHFCLTRDGDPDRDWKLLTVAGSMTQLEKYLWPEVHKWADRIIWAKVGREPFIKDKELLKTSLNLDKGAASAVSSTDTNLLEGGHADDLAYFYDEAKSIPDATFDSIAGAMTGADENSDVKAIEGMFSTPGELEGRFYEIHSKKEGLEDWHTIHVKKSEAIAAGQLSPLKDAKFAKLWGVDSQLYQNTFEGEFAPPDADGLIPMAWVEAAMERWEEMMAEGADFGALTALGVDVSDGGEDDSVKAMAHGYNIKAVEAFAKRSKKENEGISQTMAIAGDVIKELTRARGAVAAVIDANGVGAGVISRVKEQKDLKRKEKWSLISFIAHKSVKGMKDRTGEEVLKDMKAAAWLNARYILDPDNGFEPALPRNDKLFRDLILPRRITGSENVVSIESKDQIRRRNNGRSTDYGDAVVMAWYPNLPASKKRKVVVLSSASLRNSVEI